MSVPDARANFDPSAVACPVCSAPSGSIKRYSMMYRLLFLGVGYSMRRGSYTSCPACMRRMLLKSAFSPLGVLSANLMWPLAVVPYTIILITATLIPGHSASVRKALGL